MREVAKSQWVRLWDVVGLGPIMVYIGSKYPLKSWERTFMYVGGIGTMIYNLRNLIKDREIDKEPFNRI